MRINQKHKQLIKQIKQNSRCTVTPEDIYKNTNFFKEEQPKQKITFKLAFMATAILFLISLSFTIVLSIQNYQLQSKQPEIVYVEINKFIIDDTKGMPEDVKDSLDKKYDHFITNPVSCNVHNKEVTIYIYYGTNLDTNGNKIYYYYYAFSEFSDYNPPFKLYINSNILSITNDNRYGLLTTIDSSKTNDFTISFTIETEDRKCEYILKNCDY